MVSFRIKLPLSNFGLNTLICENRYSKYAGNTAKKQTQSQVAKQILKQGVGKIPTPCDIEVIWLVPTLARDLDNLLLKNILDALQSEKLFSEKILDNDNLTKVKRIHHDHIKVDKEEEGLIIKFIPISAEEVKRRDKRKLEDIL